MGSLAVLLVTSHGRSSFGPQLTLSYASCVGNGSFGFGWSLSKPAIIRQTDKGLYPQLDKAAQHLSAHGGLDFSECFIDGTFTWKGTR